MKAEEVNKYKKAVKFLALASSSIGQDLRESHKDLIEKAEKIIDQYEVQYLSELRLNSEEIKPLINDIQDAKKVLELIGDENAQETQEINQIIDSATKKIQAEIEYDPSLYYTKYFFGLESKQVDVLKTDLMKDEYFKLWFGNSKVVNEDGSPKIVYHGTGGLKYEFDTFKFDTFPINYFAEKKSYSDWFAELKGGNGLVFQCYLRVTNPVDFSEFYLDEITYQDLKLFLELRYGFEMPNSKMLDSLGKRKVWEWLRFAPDVLKVLKQTKVFDGIHYYENNPDQKIDGKDNVTPAWAIFYGNQVKSADIRNFTYSINTDRITMKRGGQL